MQYRRLSSCNDPDITIDSEIARIVPYERQNGVKDMHPISFYFTDTQKTFSPELRPENRAYSPACNYQLGGLRNF